MVLADPGGSVLAPLVATGKKMEAGSWLVEGIGEDFVPPNCDLSLVSEAFTVSDAESFATARDLLRKEAILAGSSSGTLITAALKYCRAQTIPKRVVSFVCDSGNKYLSKMFNDYWMLDQGLLARDRKGDLRDLIARRHADQATIIVAPSDSLLIAYQRMKLYEISQLPVLEGGKVIGIIDESDLLLAVYGHPDRFRAQTRAYMPHAARRLSTGQFRDHCRRDTRPWRAARSKADNASVVPAIGIGDRGGGRPSCRRFIRSCRDMRSSVA